VVIKDSWTGLEDGITDTTWGVRLPKNVLERRPTVLCGRERYPACGCDETFRRQQEYEGPYWTKLFDFVLPSFGLGTRNQFLEVDSRSSSLMLYLPK
jgi:hypothetical protein